MPSMASVRKALKRLVEDVPGTSRQVAKSRRLAMEGEGSGSIFMWPAQAIAKKLKGKKGVDKALYEHLHRPLTNIDERAGKALSREFGAKKLFRQVDVMPSGRKIGGHNALIEHERHSATAPISKSVKVLAPLGAVLYASNLMDKKHKDEEKTAGETGKEVMLTKAAAALEWAGRYQTAEKLAFEMVERGDVPPFQTYGQFHEKVANLMERDLDVIREALDIGSPAADFGKVAEAKGLSQTTPEASFYHTLAGE